MEKVPVRARRRAGPTVTNIAEIVFTKNRGLRNLIFQKRTSVCRKIKHNPMRECAVGSIWIIHDQNEAVGLGRHSGECQRRADITMFPREVTG